MRPIPRHFRFLLPTLALYAALVGAIVYHHEPWRDEADSWLAARDLTVPQIFRFSAYVGSPATWYLILAPFARLGAPYAVMGWVHAAIAIAAAAIFLRYAPFPMITRGLALFSYYLAYEYAVVARNYSLLALMLFTTASLYARRRERPIAFAIALFFLFNTTTHGALFAAIIATAVAWQWLRDRPIDRRAVAALAVILGGAIAAAIQLWPPADSQRPEFFMLRAPGAIVDVLTRAVATPIGSPMLDPLWLLMNLAVLGAATVYLIHRPVVFVVWIAGMLGLFYIFLFKWVVPERHAGIVLLWLLFALWIAQAQPAAQSRVRWWRTAMVALSVALAPACVRTVFAAVDDVRFEYSHARQMGQFIVAHDLDRRPIAATNLAEAVLPYLRCRQVWNVHTRRWQSHNPWDQTFQNNFFLRGPEVWDRLEQYFPLGQRPLILSEWPLPYAREHGYELLYRTQGRVPPTKEEFYLYAPLDAAAPAKIRD
ncbi:MAG: hypothetical protein QOE14_241 [Humisphaera sp.]|nr:hypothetical protein [Humisphaera sp.]